MSLRPIGGREHALAYAAAMPMAEPARFLDGYGEPQLDASAMPGFEPDDGTALGWPAPPGDAAYRGLAGDVVRAVQDETEADPVAILGTLLALFGVCAGHGRAFFRGSQQTANLYVVLAGNTGTGRKGTAFSIVRSLFASAYPESERLYVPGLGSGEGLIGRLADGEEPRALVLETKLGRLFRHEPRRLDALADDPRCMGRGAAGAPSGKERALVTWHHVGLLGHITPTELREKLRDVDAGNGFGNRFVWLAVRRSRLVADPQSLDGAPRAVPRPAPPRHRGGATAGRHGRHAGGAALVADVLPRADDAATLGPVRGARLAGRGAAHAPGTLLCPARPGRAGRRLALESARALWDYAERSVRYLFGDSTGNRTADAVRRYLREEAGQASRRELRSEVGVRDAGTLDAAIDLLVSLGLATRAKEPSGPKGGRRTEIIATTEGELEQLERLRGGYPSS